METTKKNSKASVSIEDYCPDYILIEGGRPCQTVWIKHDSISAVLIDDKAISIVSGQNSFVIKYRDREAAFDLVLDIFKTIETSKQAVQSGC